MRRGPSIAVLVLAAAVAVPGCAVTSGSPRESVGEGVHSVSVSNTVQIRYQADRLLAPLGLKVETYRREVFISGLVQNDAQRAHAVAIARDTPGVLDAYFVDTDLPGRPVSRAHFRASVGDVWAVTVAAVRAAGYQIEQQQEGRTLVTSWRHLDSGWVNLWLAAQERMRLALYRHGDVVTVIAVADRLDEVTLSWQINREKNMLRDIGVAMNPPAPPR
jgi:hyperosmotically inducible protein